MRDNNFDFDAIVVGSGAGGCAATYRLVNAGLRVLLIDKGHSLPRDGSTLDIDRVVHRGEFKSKERWLDGNGKVLVPEEYFNVGGKTKWYGAALARFSAAEFGADTDHQCPAWPFDAQELARFYSEAERLLGVRSLQCESDLARILKRMRNVSPAWSSSPLAIGLSENILDHPSEARHFDGFASPQRLKGDGEVKLLDALRGSNNLTVITDAPVTGLLADEVDSTRIVGVQTAYGRRYRASTVLLAMGALHTPRIVQRYLRTHRLDTLPLAQRVGSNLKLHLLTAVLAISQRVQADVLRKTVLLTHPDVPHSSVQPLGFDGELLSTLIPAYVPRPLARFIGARAYGFFLQTEDGSSPLNRVVGEAGDDQLPVLDYDAKRLPAADQEHKRLVSLFRRSLLRVGLPNFAQRIGLQGTAHACGTLMTGHDPATSAVDPEGRVHGLKGLMVVDGSVLPRSSRVNPALSIYAFSLRASEKLIERTRSLVTEITP